MQVIFTLRNSPQTLLNHITHLICLWNACLFPRWGGFSRHYPESLRGSDLHTNLFPLNTKRGMIVLVQKLRKAENSCIPHKSCRKSMVFMVFIHTHLNWRAAEGKRCAQLKTCNPQKIRVRCSDIMACLAEWLTSHQLRGHQEWSWCKRSHRGLGMR